MDFKLSEERQMLKDTIARFIRDRYDIETRHKIADEDEGFSRDMWKQFAELGCDRRAAAGEGGRLRRRG